MEAYDALPADVRKAIQESLHDVWDTWSAVALLRQGVAPCALVGMVRNQEVACHNAAVLEEKVPEVPDRNFFLKKERRGEARPTPPPHSCGPIPQHHDDCALGGHETQKRQRDMNELRDTQEPSVPAKDEFV